MTDLIETVPGDDRFAGFADVWTAVTRHDRPSDPPRPHSDHEALARQLLAPGGARTGAHRVLVEDGRTVGALRMILPLHDNTSTGALDVAVVPDARRRGHGRRLLEAGLDLLREAGRQTALVEVDEPTPGVPGRAFAQRHGFRCDLEEVRRDLLLPADAQALAVAEAAADPAYEVVTWRDRVPDALVDDRALLERRMSTDAPYGDLPLEEEHWDAARIREYEALHVARGRTVLSAGALDSGRLVAFTDLQVPLSEPRLAYQGGTLVLREHRGAGLGAAVKAAVLRALPATGLGVERIMTVNSGTNGPMIRVNEALGFRPAGGLSTWSRAV